MQSLGLDVKVVNRNSGQEEMLGGNFSTAVGM